MEIPFRVEETAGVARHGEVVRFGVPLAPGAWPPGTAMGLACRARSGSGRVRACHWQADQFWDDGSVRLAWCTAELDLEAQARLELTPSSADLLPRLAAPAATGLRGLTFELSMEGRTHELALCPSAVETTCGPVHGTPEACAAAVAVPSDGHAAPVPPAACVALVPGQVPGVPLRLEGHVRSLGGCDLLCQMTLANTGTEAVAIQQLCLAAGAAALPEGSARAQLGLDAGGLRLEEDEAPVFLQRSRVGRLTASGREPVELQYPLGGECRRNLVWGRLYGDRAGVILAVRNLGENFPCGLRLGAGRLFVDLWPDAAGTMTLDGGMSRTWEFGMVFDAGGRHGAQPAAVQRIHHPLAVAVPTARLELLGCFGRLGPYLPERYPKLESWIHWLLANRPRAYGWQHFGDEPAFGYMPRARDPEELMFLNNEYDFPLVALGQFCRSGDRIAYEDGRAAVLHMMDIDTAAVHADPVLEGGQYSHAPGHVTHPPAPDHEWLEGLLLWHVVTGEARPLERARALAERLVRLAAAGHFDTPGHTARRYGWPLIALCSIHAFSRQAHYLEAARRIVAGMARVEAEAGGLRSPYWGLPYLSLDTFMLGIGTAGLCRYHALTRSQPVAEMILRACDALLELATPEGVLPYKEYPLVRVHEPVSTTVALEALAYGYELSGRRAYLELGARNLENAFEMLRAGIVLEWNAEQRQDFSGGAWFRARATELSAQHIGLLVRGIRPFLAVAEQAGFYGPGANPFAFVSGGSRTP